MSDRFVVFTTGNITEARRAAATRRNVLRFGCSRTETTPKAARLASSPPNLQVSETSVEIVRCWLRQGRLILQDRSKAETFQRAGGTA